nr:MULTISPECIES: conjugal transfer protein TraG N-terminal domain-containing protein [unclassified Dyella]
MGDGLYMKRVLDGVASMSNSGLFVSLGALGLLLGLLMVAVKHVSNNAQKTEFGVLFLSFIAFTVMFGMRADVIIHDLGGAPGAVQNGTFPVDNVPFGVAAAGSIISTLGLTLSEKMEQGYGLPSGGTNPDGTTGFGRSLEWINAVRNWELPEFDDTGSNGLVSRFKNNVSYYLANCTFVAAGNSQLNMAKAFNTSDPFSFGDTTTGGLGYNNKFITTKWEDKAHNITDMDCSAALNQLKADAGDDSLFSAFANASAVRMKRVVPGYPAAQQMRDAFNDIGMAGDEAAAYTMSSAVNAVWSMALRRGSDPSGLDVMTAVMVNQGTEQRATQWGADESMFRQVARPMAAFFESMIYAMAPFMALVVGLGAWGFQKLMTYMVLTIWVALWLPVLSVVNLFQVTMAQHAVDAMNQVPPGATPLSVTSIAGAANLQHQIVNWLATGATIAAATPAITMMLIFGGAVTASALAGRMQGAEFSNEKMVSPDSVKDAPIMERGSMESHSQIGGSHITGASAIAPKYSGATIGESAVSSSSAALEASSNNLTSTASKAISQSFQNEIGQTVSGSHMFQGSASQSQQEMAKWGTSQGYDIKSGQEQAWAAVMAMSAAGQGQAAAGIAKAAGISLAAGSSSRHEFTEKDAQALGEQIKRDSSYNKAMTAQMATAVNDTVQNMASQGSKIAESAVGSNQYQSALSDMKSKQEQFQEAQSLKSQFGSSQQIDSIQAATGIAGRGHADEVINAAKQHAGVEAFNYARQYVQGSGWGSSDSKVADVQAALVALEGKSLPVAGREALRAGHESDRSQALLKALGQGGAMFGGDVSKAALGDPYRNSGLASDVVKGVAAQQVGGHPLGSGLNENNIKGQAQSLVSGASVPEATGAVVQRAGIGEAVANMDQQSRELEGYRQDPNAANAVSGRVRDQFETNTGVVQKEAADLKNARAKEMANNDTGGLAKDMKRFYDDRVSAATNHSAQSAQGAMSIARAVNGGEAERDIAKKQEFMMDERGKQSMTFGFGGITSSSAKDVATDPTLRSDANQWFGGRADQLIQSEGNYQSRDLLVAKAAIDAVHAHNGATPEIVQAYDSSVANLTPDERKNLEAYEQVAHTKSWGGGVGDMSGAEIALGQNPEGMQLTRPGPQTIDRNTSVFGPGFVGPGANSHQGAVGSPSVGGDQGASGPSVGAPMIGGSQTPMSNGGPSDEGRVRPGSGAGQGVSTPAFGSTEVGGGRPNQGQG